MFPVIVFKKHAEFNSFAEHHFNNVLRFISYWRIWIWGYRRKFKSLLPASNIWFNPTIRLAAVSALN
jgi:hypothetical protein